MPSLAVVWCSIVNILNKLLQPHMIRQQGMQKDWGISKAGNLKFRPWKK